MTDKVQKIREEVERLRKSYQIMYQELDCESPKLISVCAKRNLCQDILMFIDSLQEEPVSDELEKAAVEAFKKIVDSDKNNFLEIFKAGAKWQKESLWKPANGDDLPEYEREVVVFTQNYPDDAGMMMVAIGHRPTPEGYDGRSLTTGKVEHYILKTYDKGGWNIPDVKYWLDVDLPKEIEL